MVSNKLHWQLKPPYYAKSDTRTDLRKAHGSLHDSQREAKHVAQQLRKAGKKVSNQ
jgi:hypothetical protein